MSYLYYSFTGNIVYSPAIIRPADEFVVLCAVEARGRRLNNVTVKSAYSVPQVKCVTCSYIYFFSRTLVLIFTSFLMVLPVFLVPVSPVVMVSGYVLICFLGY